MNNVRPNASRSTQGFLADSGLQIIKQSHYLYTRYPIVARALGLAAAVQPLGRVRARAKESCIQSHYMLDFNLSDGFLFRKIEYGLNGVDLMDQYGVRKSVLHIFRHISEDFLVRHLCKLRYHAKRVIENVGHLLPE